MTLAPGSFSIPFTKRAVAALLAIAAGATLVACSNSGRQSSQATTTTASATTTTKTTTTTPASRAGGIPATDGSFTVNLPKGWRSMEPDSGLLIKLGANDGSNVNVTLNPTETRGRNIQESAELNAKLMTDQLKAVIDPGGIEATTLNGEPARRYTYTVPPGPQIPHTARGRQLFAAHHDIEYVVTYTGSPQAFNNDVAAYEQIIDSWKWSN